MSFVSWVILGLLVGAIAKGILSESRGAGWILTMGLGVVGAIVGGFLGSTLFNSPLQDFFSLQTWLLALSGAIVTLLVYALVTPGSRKA